MLARICLRSLSTPRMYYFSASHCGVKNLPIKQVRNTGTSLSHVRSHVQGFVRGSRCAVTEPPHCITVPLFIRSLFNFYIVPFMNNFFLCVSFAVCEKMPGNSSRNHTSKNKAINGNNNKCFCMNWMKKKNVSMSLRKARRSRWGNKRHIKSAGCSESQMLFIVNHTICEPRCWCYNCIKALASCAF